MRVFIGIELDVDVKEYLYKVQNFIKPSMISGDLTNFNNYHLTTIYIGHVDDEEIDIIKDCMFLACDQLAPFDMKLNGIHSFNKGRHSILWVGVESGKEHLNKLYKAIVQELMEEGFELDYSRKYRPHITIGKKMVMGPQSTTEVFPYFYDSIKVKTLTLFHSHRVKDVLTYTPIYRIDL